jgi:hypothetical protein
MKVLGALLVPGALVGKHWSRQSVPETTDRHTFSFSLESNEAGKLACLKTLF